MPAIAPAALVRIREEIWLIPEMSTTEYIIVTSVAPTYGRVSPEATVETMSFGTPTGRSRIACAAIDELPEPPTAAAPSRRPSACSRASTAAAPRPMASTAAPRSAGADELGVVGAAGARDLLARRRRASTCGSPSTPASTRSDVDAGLAEAVAQEAVLDALRVQRADEDDGRPSAALHAQVAALQLGVGRRARRPSSRRRSARPPSRAGARPSPWPSRGSARRRGSRGPRPRAPRKVSISVSMIVGASPSEGSSMISSLGLASSARPMASICCSPPESCMPPFWRRSARRGKSS